MVRNATFGEITKRVIAAKAEKDKITVSKSESKKQEKDELFPYMKDKPIPGTLYGAPYANPLVDQANIWKMPGSRTCQGAIMDLYLDFILKIYKSLAKAILCLGGAVFSFMMLPGMFAAIGILFLVAAGGFFMDWRNWQFFHNYSIKRVTLIRPMGNDRYYPRYKYKKGVVPIG